jgi:hypothetical protein
VKRRLAFWALWLAVITAGLTIFAVVDSGLLGLLIVFALGFVVFLAVGLRIRRQRDG